MVYPPELVTVPPDPRCAPRYLTITMPDPPDFPVAGSETTPPPPPPVLVLPLVATIDTGPFNSPLPPPPAPPHPWVDAAPPNPEADAPPPPPA